MVQLNLHSIQPNRKETFVVSCQNQPCCFLSRTRELVLFGDQNRLMAKPSAFDRINVRRLFLVLEKSIARAAKFQLFEFNDALYQSTVLKSLVEPFLRDVQARRGISDFSVVCDGSNNTC